MVQIFQFLFFLIYCYNIVFFVWILSTWIPVERSFFFFRFIDALIEPVYFSLLRVLPPLRIGIIDFSPFYMMIFLNLLEFLVKILANLVLR